LINGYSNVELIRQLYFIRGWRNVTKRSKVWRNVTTDMEKRYIRYGDTLQLVWRYVTVSMEKRYTQLCENQLKCRKPAWISRIFGTSSKLIDLNRYNRIIIELYRVIVIDFVFLFFFLRFSEQCRLMNISVPASYTFY
jgi:hypothetical protein